MSAVTSVCVRACVRACSLVLESLELCKELLVVLLGGRDHVIFHSSEGIDEVVTETRVDVLGRHTPSTRTVLSPVGEITGEDVGGSYEVRRTQLEMLLSYSTI